jgi:hypothetical protein
MSVMANRREPPDSLDFFPTPPWATRALCEHDSGLLTAWPSDPVLKHQTAWEPAAGEGHMAAVLGEYFSAVRASDVHDYGVGYEVGSFVGEGSDTLSGNAHWIITNPPFNLAAEFAIRAYSQAVVGVALLTRTAWLESSKRHNELFSVWQPSIVGLFVERVPMIKGRWDPKASTATSYAWVIWHKKDRGRGPTQLRWISPGRRAALTKPDDAARFAFGRDAAG